MAKSNTLSEPAWSEGLVDLGRSIHETIKKAKNLPEDPFRKRNELEAISRALSSVGLERFGPPQAIRDEANALCTQLTAEFWKRFSAACEQNKWDLHGATSRRLLCRAIFVELKAEAVVVEGVAGELTPHLTTLVERLKVEVPKVLAADFNATEFLELVAQAYDRLAGAGIERSLEDVYRAFVLYSQKQQFWRTLDVSRLAQMTRPMFRARLTECLRLGLKSADGRELRLGTTTQPREAWELYSPGEQRVVQVGRLGLVRKEGGAHA